ncbi:hypothetical protein GJU43_21835 [Flavobacterium sp. LC2016-23]|uniref:hypothetical protein n=1 Tax=Flavobacterium sp. LC2016-23 TaxID=2666330 RepID=UPI0012B0EAD5|nr:hypothetical protein [Flavobacterium sp. LC2016-23]MRX41929.1 hypothetical protein [Flavobacterium sp. LC2016-23]
MTKIKEFIYLYFKTFIIIFSILSLTSVTPFWWISLLSIIFFIWNIFNKKEKLSLCIIFLSLTVLLNIFNFTILIPAKKWGDKLQAEWNKTGYDSAWLSNAQESINIADRAIEDFKLKYGTYPNSLSDIKEFFIDSHDRSYRIKQSDGQTNGVTFFYEKLDSNKFYLAGVGKDGLIKTDDDLLPQISKEQKKTTGLVKYEIKSFTPQELDRERKVLEMLRKAKKLDKIFNK